MQTSVVCTPPQPLFYNYLISSYYLHLEAKHKENINGFVGFFVLFLPVARRSSLFPCSGGMAYLLLGHKYRALRIIFGLYETYMFRFVPADS